MSTASGGQQQSRKLSDSAAPTGKSQQGYLSTLGLTFGATQSDVTKAYRKAALASHPDKLTDPTSPARAASIDKFQATNTAYSVLRDDEARRRYMAMYRIRCFLFQQPHVKGAALAPYYVLKVHKADLLGLEQQRVLTLDLLSGTMQNWKKDEAHRVTPLSDLKEVQLNGPTSIILSFSTPGLREYKLSVDSEATCALYTSVFRAICAAGGVASARPLDDACFPPPSLKKGFVEKASSASMVGGEWARRWIVLGSSTLLIFRDATCDKMVNAVPLHNRHECKVELGLEGGWSLNAGGRRWAFRNSKASIAKSWVGAVINALEQPVGNWLQPGGGGGGGGSDGGSGGRPPSDADAEAADNPPLLIDAALEEAAVKEEEEQGGQYPLSTHVLLEDEEEIDAVDTTPLPPSANTRKGSLTRLFGFLTPRDGSRKSMNERSSTAAPASPPAAASEAATAPPVDVSDDALADAVDSEKANADGDAADLPLPPPSPVVEIMRGRGMVSFLL